MSIVRLIDGTPGDTQRLESGDIASLLPDSIRFQNGDPADLRTENKAQALRLLVETESIRVAFNDSFPSPGLPSSELMPNAVDRDFSGPTAWANTDLFAFDETTDLTITADAIGQFCTLPVASAPMNERQQYSVKMDIASLVSTWALQDFTGAQVLATIDAEGAQVEFIVIVDAGLTGGFRLVSLAADSSANFDNFTVTREALGHLLVANATLRPRSPHAVSTLKYVNETVGSNAIITVTADF